VPFLPFVLLLAWQALSRGASFALGWATSMYFGQVPGRQGRILAVISLFSAAWVILVVGFGVPIFTGAGLEAAGVIGENFDVRPIHYVALTGGILVTPPAIAAATVYARFHEDGGPRQILRMIPMSYPATAMLGLSVLQMVILTPILLFQRWRQHRVLVQVPLVMRDGTDATDLEALVRRGLGSLGFNDITVEEATGPKSWPMRTTGFAVRHLLGAVVRGEPIRLAVDDLEVLAYATNVSTIGPEKEAYRVRAAMERELAFGDAYLTWNEEAQGFEDALLEIHRSANGNLDALERRLDTVQEKMDAASLNSEEWNVLFRLRLQVEDRAERRHAAG
jgi:hypothetical protein